MATLDFEKRSDFPTGGDIVPNRFYLVNDPITKRLRVGMSTNDGADVKKAPDNLNMLSVQAAKDHIEFNRSTPANTLSNSGLGVVGIGWHVADVGGALTATLDNDYFHKYNSTTESAHPYWEGNNGSFGGTRAALSTNMVAFIEYLGKHLPHPSAPRYDFAENIGTGITNVPNPHWTAKNGIGFINTEYQTLADLSAGTHLVSFQGVDNWLSLIMRYIIPQRSTVCAAMWIRVYTGTMTTYATYRDDLLVASTDSISVPVLITPADGWVHISTIGRSRTGYVSPFRIYTTEDTRYEIGMPFAAPGAYNISMAQHVSHIVSSDEYQ